MHYSRGGFITQVRTGKAHITASASRARCNFEVPALFIQ